MPDGLTYTLGDLTAAPEPVSSGPRLCDIVHRRNRDECRPAIVTRVVPDGVNLTEFGPGLPASYMRVVRGDVEGTWHPQEECPDA